MLSTFLEILTLILMFDRYKEDQVLQDYVERVEHKKAVIESLVDESSTHLLNTCANVGKKEYVMLLEEGCREVKKTDKCSLSFLRLSKLKQLDQRLDVAIKNCAGAQAEFERSR